MTDDFSIEIDSSLNTTLEGTTGTFKIGDGANENSSLEVKYFLTHVGLDFQNSQNNRILSELAPVREIFDTESLDFDQIMQRDINDARVSSKLIPYILDEKNQASVKFFPPIVIMALPVNPDGSTIQKKYPKVSIIEDKDKKQGVSHWHITRSGELGEETFQFEQPVIGGKISKKKLVKFKIDNKRCKLVIVDGQHRAMALLALYRNKNSSEWTDARRKPYQPYYEEWTPDYINQFNLDEVELPVIICTVPGLDDSYKGDYSIEKAARSIFLTLNKTARPVSNSRNLLLDDNDLISYFMRSVLSEIKNDDQRSSNFLRINNIDLDEEKTKLHNPIAITSVTSIYYIIEHAVLSGVDSIKGLADRKGKFRLRSDFEDGLVKLNAYDELRSEVSDNLSRYHFTTEAAVTLDRSFMETYGQYIIKTFSDFSPFNVYSEASIDLQRNIKKSDDTHILSMIFNGQGEVNVFEEYLKDLKDKKERQSLKDLPRVQKVLDDLSDTKKRLESRIQELYKIRTSLYLKQNKDKSKILQNADFTDVFHRILSKIYSDIFSAQAFQAALICTFLGEVDHLKLRGIDDLIVEDTFNEYLDQINSFFHPKSLSGLKKLFSVFGWEIDLDKGLIKKNTDNFSSVVSLQEMKPNSWPKYRYILLEIWRPTHTELAKVAETHLNICRSDMCRQVYREETEKFVVSNRMDIGDLDEKQIKKIETESYFSINEFLKKFGNASELKETQFKTYIH